MKCDLCNDAEGPKQLRAKCHITAPLRAEYHNGILKLYCYVPDCNRLVADFLVKPDASVMSPDAGILTDQ